MNKQFYQLSIFLTAFLLFFALAEEKTVAQQDARYTQYMFNGLLLNPAYAGSSGNANISAFYRTQWVGLDGAPTSITLSGHGALGDDDQVGVGGFLEYDDIGLHNTLRFFGTYSYHLKIGGGKLGIGLQAGGAMFNADLSQAQTTGTSGTDDPVFQNDLSRFMPNFGIGLYYHSERFYLGASVPQLLTNRLKSGESSISLVGQQYRHYFFTTGVVLELSENFKIIPSALVKMVPINAPIQVDLNVNLMFANAFWVGSSIRMSEEMNPESLDFLLGFKLKNGLRIGYSYDLTLSDLADFNSGSHEIGIGFDFGGGGDRRIITPRYF
ncbi:MAG: PorP/SprF family type IX secretion system membrane protein [Chitinophagales bacterium]